MSRSALRYRNRVRLRRSRERTYLRPEPPPVRVPEPTLRPRVGEPKEIPNA